MEPTTTQAVVSGLSDLLVSQRPELLYAIPLVMMVVGGTFWVLGHQIHQIFIMVVFLAGGIYTGWFVGNTYGFTGVNAVVAMAVGGLLGAGIGYWLFRLWLGFLAAGLIGLVLMLLYTFNIAVPYLDAARQSAQEKMVHHGLELAGGSGGQNSPKPTPGLPEPSAVNTSIGQAYNDLVAHFPKLSRAKYPDYPAWRENVVKEGQTVWNCLLVIMPRLQIDLFLTLGVALIIGLVCTVVRPIFLDVAYTSLLGLALLFGGILMLVVLRDVDELTWLRDNALTVAGVLAIIWLVGLALQYKMIPAPPPPPEDADDDAEGGEKEKDHGGKKRK